MSDLAMFPQLSQVGATSRHEIPPRPTALREHLNAVATALHAGKVKLAWHWLRTVWRLLKLIRFSLLLAAVVVGVMLCNEQAQDALRALGEEPGSPTVLFVVAALMCAAVVWWHSLVIFDSKASDPEVMPKFKFFPSVLGALALIVTGISVIRASFAYENWSYSVRWLLVIGIVLFLIALIFLAVTIACHERFNAHEPRPASLSTLRQVPHVRLLFTKAAACLVFTLLFAYFPVELAPWIGTPALALLAVTIFIWIGTFPVCICNHYQFPIVRPVLLWAVINSSLFVDNHFVRLHDEMETHSRSEEVPPKLQAEALHSDMQSLELYIKAWVKGLQDERAKQPAPPVVLVAAEGGGIRAAYWTALVLGQLHDEAPLDFARHTLAISGVSGGSLGAAAYAALVANQHMDPESDPLEGCPVDEGGDPTKVRSRAERMLDHDFLSPAVAVMLFPDLFQHLVPVPFINDRAKALERSWQAAWDACETGERFTQPLQNLWADDTPFSTPLLFLNSTVIETGQRLIAAPVPIEPSRFSHALDSRQVIGETVPLATAVHNSARFTYLSPAGLVKRQDVPDKWLRVVDGGYFENSGAVTLSEILELLLEVVEEVDREAEETGKSFKITPIVIHISNDPETTEPEEFDDARFLAGQIRAPIRALLNTRPARGFQAREALHRRVLDLNEADDELRAYHFHFRLCRERAPLPLGWTLSRAAEQEIRRQLGTEESDDDSIAARNRDLRVALLRVLAGDQDPRGLENGFTCPSEKEQARPAADPVVNS